jgi:hypothetical protein
MISRESLVDIYNEYDGDMYGSSSINEYGYKFPRINEYGESVATPTVFSDIQLMNNKSSLIREGVLTFDEDMESEIYKALNLYPERDVNYFKKKDILKIILNPTDENIEKVIKITSNSTMGRFKGLLTKIINDNQYNVVNIMVDYINARDWELKQGIRNSDLKIIKREIPAELLQVDKIEEVIEKKVVQKEVVINEEPKVVIKKETKKPTNKKVNK